MSQDPVPPLPKPKSGVNGCLIGCLVAFLAAVVGVGLVGYFTYDAATSAINEMTESTPRDLPAVAISDEARTAADEKFARFKSALENGGGEKEFFFTGDEINVLLRSNKTAVFGEGVFVTIVNGEVRGEVSLDLGKLIPIWIFKGRYANGSAVFNVYTENDQLYVYVTSFQIKGKDAPQEIMDQLRAKNFAQELKDDPNIRRYMSKIQEISVDADKLVVKLK